MSMDYMFDALVIGLATWRISSLLSREDGPFYIFSRIRHVAGVEYDINSKPIPKNELSRGLLCLWCSSIWVAIAFCLVYFLWPLWTVMMLMPFAVSTIAIIIDGHNKTD